MVARVLEQLGAAIGEAGSGEGAAALHAAFKDPTHAAALSEKLSAALAAQTKDGQGLKHVSVQVMVVVVQQAATRHATHVELRTAHPSLSLPISRSGLRRPF